jgi:hypothetical protein
MSDQVQGAHDEFNIADIGGPGGQDDFLVELSGRCAVRRASAFKKAAASAVSGNGAPDCERRKQRL